ncbi:MAG: hypothetical protein WBE99_12520, partial [Xanthobacteraceae bacterium]
APDPHELTRSLQFELQRVGCFNGVVNGEFDDPTKAAWRHFIKPTSVSTSDAVSVNAIDAVRGINKRVCPLVCQGGQHADGEVCVIDAPPAATRSPPQLRRSQSVVDARSLPIGTVIEGGQTTCGPNGCQHVPKNCHAVKLGRVNNPAWKGLGGKIVCP